MNGKDSNISSSSIYFNESYNNVEKEIQNKYDLQEIGSNLVAIENKPKQDVRLDDGDNYALNCYQKMNKIKLKTELNSSNSINILPIEKIIYSKETQTSYSEVQSKLHVKKDSYENSNEGIIK